MRRKDRERTDKAFMDLVFDQARELSLALFDGEFPYCLPFNFARIDNRLYIHSAKEGKKLDLIRQNPHVAFCLAIDVEIDRQKSATYYKSLCGTGLASIVEDIAEKGRALDALAKRYAALCKTPSPMTNINRVAIIGIDIVQLSGKCCEKKQAS